MTTKAAVANKHRSGCFHFSHIAVFNSSIALTQSATPLRSPMGSSTISYVKLKYRPQNTDLSISAMKTLRATNQLYDDAPRDPAANPSAKCPAVRPTARAAPR